MATMETLKDLYEQYEITAVQVRKKAPAFAGAFGLGNDPRDHQCHDEFYNAVGTWMDAFVKTDPSAEASFEIVRFILEAADKNRQKETYWYLYAAQGHVLPLIPRLRQEDCCQLLAFYKDAYPAPDRLPVHRELYKLLQQHSGQKGASGSFLGKLFAKK